MMRDGSITFQLVLKTAKSYQLQLDELSDMLEGLEKNVQCLPTSAPLDEGIEEW